MALILCIILAVFILANIFSFYKTKILLRRLFSTHNIIVFGAKGKGKDLLFQKVIASLNKKKPYMSNIDYGYKYIHKDPKELNLDPNTYQNFIAGAVIPIKHDARLEGVNYFLSDGGVFLPSQEDKTLHKDFKSFPLYYALSRHWLNSSIHVNTQALNRLWRPLREQADFFIKCNRVRNYGLFLVGEITLYERYESAMNNARPPSKKALNKFNNALYNQYQWSNGYIENRKYIIWKKQIKYDTRYFKKVLTGEIS